MAQEAIIVVAPAETLPTQQWWEDLHFTINTSFKSKDFAAFPSSWERLPSDSAVAARSLADELGPDGILAVVLIDGRPVACGGVTPFRGDNWIDAVKSADHAQELEEPPADPRPRQATGQPFEMEGWELCCVCVHPRHRRWGWSEKIIDALEHAVKPRGATRLISTYVKEEIGEYWERMGFMTVPGAGGVLKKGFTAQPGMPGLLADIHFAMGCKVLKH